MTNKSSTVLSGSSLFCLSNRISTWIFLFLPVVSNLVAAKDPRYSYTSIEDGQATYYQKKSQLRNKSITVLNDASLFT